MTFKRYYVIKVKTFTPITRKLVIFKKYFNNVLVDNGIIILIACIVINCSYVIIYLTDFS